jgi:cell division protein FtsB
LYRDEKLDTSIEHMDPESDDASANPAAPRRRRRLESVQEARSARRSAAMWVLSFVLGVLVVSALVGEHGYLAALRARQELRRLETSLLEIRLENQRLQNEAERLDSDPAALEEAARGDLGLIRPGETLVILHDVRPAPTPAR